MGSTTTLRNDAARTGTNTDFPINTNPWRKYTSIDLGQSTIGGRNYDRIVRAGVLVVESWLFHAGAHKGETHTLVLVATTTNELYCFGERDLLANREVPLWHGPLLFEDGTPVSPIVTQPNPNLSNMWPLVGVCGTPVVDIATRRMFVVAMWDDGTGTGHYSIFNVDLDTGKTIKSRELIDTDPAADVTRAKFHGKTVDQRTAINLVADWLWMGFADFQQNDLGLYYGWMVAINADDLSQQLYKPLISLNSTSTYGIYGGGVWGAGGVASAADGTVYALTGNATRDPSGNSPNADDLTSYWAAVPAAGPGSLGDYFDALVRLQITGSGSTSQISVFPGPGGWFQDSTFTKTENAGDFDFGGSSPVVLPVINGRQLVAFVPKDGNVFLLNSQNLGNYTTPLTLVPFADLANHPNGNYAKVAPAFLQTSDGRNILIVASPSNGSKGGLAAFQVDATATPPTLTQLWKSSLQLQNYFGSPTVIANPVIDPSAPPNPVGLAWFVDGADNPPNLFLRNCVMQAYDVLTGAVAYDSTTTNDLDGVNFPHFAPITSGGNSVFCATTKGFMGFTQGVSSLGEVSFFISGTGLRAADRVMIGLPGGPGPAPTLFEVAGDTDMWVNIPPAASLGLQNLPNNFPSERISINVYNSVGGLIIDPPPLFFYVYTPSVISIGLSSGILWTGTSSIGTVTLNETPPDEGVNVQLSVSGPPGILIQPAILSINDPTELSGAFTISLPATPGLAIISAAASGNSTLYSQEFIICADQIFLSVNPDPGSDLSWLQSDQPATCTIYLREPAPRLGGSITISHVLHNVICGPIPTNIHIRAGATKASFDLTPKATVRFGGSVTIIASYEGNMAQIVISVTAAPPPVGQPGL